MISIAGFTSYVLNSHILQYPVTSFFSTYPLQKNHLPKVVPSDDMSRERQQQTQRDRLIFLHCIPLQYSLSLEFTAPNFCWSQVHSDRTPKQALGFLSFHPVVQPLTML